MANEDFPENLSNRPSLERYIRLADDRKIENTSVGYNDADGDLWIWIEKGMTFVEAFGVFSDTSKTAKIIFHDMFDRLSVYEGFTILHLIRQDGEKISICMKKA